MKLKIFLITSDNCSKCISVKNILNEIKKEGINLDIKELKHNTMIAAKIAVSNGITKIPGIIIEGGKVFDGRRLRRNEIREAVVELWKKNTKNTKK